jgi:hypothetical protein
MSMTARQNAAMPNADRSLTFTPAYVGVAPK